MNLQSVNLIFVIGLAGFAEVVNGLCLIRNTAEAPKWYWYQCSMSNNYESDVESAPVDVARISFGNSKMEVIRNRSFARLSSGLEIFQIYFSEIRDIEDHAFESLVRLHTLEIVGCKLRIFKGVWFKDLTSLKTVSFRDNEIKFFEDSFFSTVSPLHVLDISVNNLECLPVSSFGGFRTNEFRVADNPLSLRCLAELMNWLKDKNIRHDYTGQNNIDLPLVVLNACVKKSPTNNLEEEFLENCVERTLVDFLLPQENYTMKQLCQSLQNKPSPFLNCPM